MVVGFKRLNKTTCGLDDNNSYLQLLIRPFQELNLLSVFLFLDGTTFSFALLNGVALRFQLVHLSFQLFLVVV